MGGFFVEGTGKVPQIVLRVNAWVNTPQACAPPSGVRGDQSWCDNAAVAAIKPTTKLRTRRSLAGPCRQWRMRGPYSSDDSGKAAGHSVPERGAR